MSDNPTCEGASDPPSTRTWISPRAERQRPRSRCSLDSLEQPVPARTALRTLALPVAFKPGFYDDGADGDWDFFGVRYDVSFSSPGSNFWLWKNNGTAAAANFDWNGSTNPDTSVSISNFTGASGYYGPGDVRHLQMADLDDDGHLEPLLEVLNVLKRKAVSLDNSGDSGFTTYSKTTKSTTSTTDPIQRYLSLDGTIDYLGLAAGDVDGDGAWDVFAGGESGDTADMQLYLNAGSATTPSFGSATYPFDSYSTSNVFSTPVLADLDGDGDLDLVVGTGTSSIDYYRNDTEFVTGTASGVSLSGEMGDAVSFFQFGFPPRKRKNETASPSTGLRRRRAGGAFARLRRGPGIPQRRQALQLPLVAGARWAGGARGGRHRR